ncbi:MAG: phosphotransferase family protein [Chloroflexi bacterium]|nr:phosphotransferase family protein [Chloroflexota bacterium]
MATIEQVIAAIPAWRDRAVAVEPVDGGLTNRNYIVEVEGERAFVRIAGAGTELLAVDRANELFNTRAAASVDVGPRVLHELPDLTAFVLEYLPGRTMSKDAFREEAMPDRVAGTLRRLHAGPRFQRDFDMFRLTERYLRVCDERSIRIPDGYRDRLPLIPRMEAALALRPLPTVPCHNDLLAENYLADGSRLWIVDYEYSGNNDPCFELGNTCQELGWEDDRIARLCGAYFGRVTPALIARMRLQMIMSDVGWSLWAAIQARMSSIDYDFWGWAVERWERAAGALSAPDFERWLSEVAVADR